MKVDIDHAVPGGGIDRLNRSHRRDACPGDDHVDLAKVLVHLGAHALHLRQIAHICLPGPHGGLRTQSGSSCMSGPAIHIEQCESGAARVERGRERAAQASRGAGDQHRGSVQLHAPFLEGHLSLEAITSLGEPR